MKTYLVQTNDSLTRVIGLLYKLNLTKPWEITIKLHQKKRNNEQNKLYWATLNDIAEATQYSAEVWHEYFKRKFIGLEEYEVMGEVVQKGISTTTLTVSEFADYVTRVQQFAASELGVI